jgi:hypothetical protein
MGFPEPRMSGGMKLLSSDLQREWKLVTSRVGRVEDGNHQLLV